jgi:NAD-dependent dihydropyrimidine dehydrogenase PreA subunit
MNELPLLDPTRCTGCGECVAACPTRCLEMAGSEPRMPRPWDCKSCGVCVLLCPTHALKFPSPEPSAESQ